VIIDIADAVVASLNAGSFSIPFTAQRQYRPVLDLPQLQALHVTVVPRDVTIASAGRDRNQHDCRIDIAVQKKIDQERPAEIDPLMALVEQIADHFRLRRPEGFAEAVWVRTENVPIYSVEHLEQHRVFTSVLTLTFRVLR
jgi:hypothetical protein